MAVGVEKRAYGIWLVAIASLAALVVALYGYLAPNDGITFTPGALLVVVSSALILGASLVLGLLSLPRWASVLLYVLLLLGLLGTGFAAWFLETYLLVALMVVGLIGWIIHLLRPRLFSAAPTGAGAHP